MRKLLQPAFCIFILGLFTLKINYLQAQTQTTWHNYQTTSQVQIDYSDPANCSFSDNTVQAEYIFLKIKNLTNQSITVSFRTDVYYVGTGCGTCSNEEYLHTFNIPANGTLEADCNFTATGMYNLAVFKKFISRSNKREFEKFEINGLIVQ